MNWSVIPSPRKLIPALVALSALPLAAGTASAAPVSGTIVSGALSASYPLAISLTQAAIGTSSSSGLNVVGGALLVADTRSQGTCGAWNTSATLTDFADPTATHTVPSGSVKVNPGGIIASLANPQGSGANAGTNSTFTTPTTQVMMMNGGGIGCGTFGLNPTFTWTIPPGTYAAQGGTLYTATMTFTTQ